MTAAGDRHPQSVLSAWKLRAHWLAWQSWPVIGLPLAAALLARMGGLSVRRRDHAPASLSICCFVRVSPGKILMTLVSLGSETRGPGAPLSSSRLRGRARIEGRARRTRAGSPGYGGISSKDKDGGCPNRVLVAQKRFGAVQSWLPTGWRAPSSALIGFFCDRGIWRHS